MSWIAVGVAAVAVVGSIKSSQDQEAQADAAQSTNQANATQQLANMQAVEAQASAQEEAQRRQSGAYLGKQRAALGDSGTGSLGSGSNFDVARQSAVSAELDALNIRYGGELRGTQYLQSAYNYQAGADAAGAQAAQIGSTMYTSAALAGVSSYSKSYTAGQRVPTGTK
ncbi:MULTISPECIES: hypothetical protein [unclassified Achromobacter]|uniref:hypothetical protein n=1 Tax=unclassified Achromobacter TaxID=2626865 RepID=UPI000B51D8E0|nr:MULTISPECIES: hypothetical protein [unclassified Achromobacter]OWT68092.1 hypothetical protein CEY05_29090 [Achromobacter sp. HZ34]OWT69929.1 hypothetical protein CEY04_27920 [Achromobacter sp. HZ28]